MYNFIAFFASDWCYTISLLFRSFTTSEVLAWVIVFKICLRQLVCIDRLYNSGPSEGLKIRVCQ